MTMTTKRKLRTADVIIRPVDPKVRSKSFPVYGAATEPVLEELRRKLRAAVEPPAPTNTSGKE